MVADIMTESSCCCQRSDTELRMQILYSGFVGIVGQCLWELVTTIHADGEDGLINTL